MMFNFKTKDYCQWCKLEGEANKACAILPSLLMNLLPIPKGWKATEGSVIWVRMTM